MGFALKKPADVAGSATPAICIGLFVAFGGILFGYVADPLPSADAASSTVEVTAMMSSWILGALDG
jgi:hypothetical protein